MANGNNHLEQRRKEILAAAEKVFDAHGYASTTMDAVAAEARISKGSLYNYFESKQHLFEEVFKQTISGDVAFCEQLIAMDATAVEKIDKLLDHWVERRSVYLRVGRVMFEYLLNAARGGPDSGSAVGFSESRQLWEDLVASMVRQGIESGQFQIQSDPDIAASLIVAQMMGINTEAILDMRAKELSDDYVKALKRATFDALGAGKNPVE